MNSGRRVCNFFIPTVKILLYHRVEDITIDPYKLCVSPDNFRDQIKFLRDNFKIVPLVKLVQDLRNGKIQNDTIVITFDDGYADNLYNALPILEEFNVPATIFLTAGYISPAAKLRLNKPFYWDVGTPENNRGRPVTLGEARRLSSSRLIEVGGHTISHPKLADLSEGEQFKEISGGKQMLENMFDFPILGFAYPFGDKESFDKNTTKLVKAANFNYACSNIHKRVTGKSNTYALPRFIVRNWTAKELEEEMKKWL